MNTVLGSTCLISARNLGDAVMHANVLTCLQRAGRANRYIVWTFYQARFLFEGLSNTEIICSDFPMGSSLKSFFSLKGIMSFLNAVWLIRRMKVDEGIDLVGDFRERLCLILIKPLRLHSPEWEKEHLFRKYNLMLPFRHNKPISIPSKMINLYQAEEHILDAILLNYVKKSYELSIPNFQKDAKITFGIHPFASTNFKLWPFEYWVELIDILHRQFQYSSFVIFGSPNDSAALKNISERLYANHVIFNGSLSEFKLRLAQMDLLIGLDSFSVHLAHSLQVPSILLVGANNPLLFTPPTSLAVYHSGRCPVQPCGGRPSCLGSNYQFSCMIDISPNSVANLITTHS